MDNRFFNSYPYTDFHELNLSWVIQELRSFATTLEQFVSINALKYADPIQWNITSQYEKNTIVIDPATGTAYISVAAVPAGVSIANTDYWTVVFDLSLLVEKFDKNLALKVETLPTTTASYTLDLGDLVVWNSVLYQVISPITPGDAYALNSNIKKITVEELIETTYYPNDKALEICSKISDYGQIVASGDIHVYNPQREAIEIIRLED